jgi:Domain of unknown function (DUF4133)
MITSIIYPTYRAIERPLYFKGFAGKYILFAAAALIGDLLLFVVLYVCRTPPWLCVLIAFGLGTASLLIIGRLSRRFGAHGLENYLAARRLPRTIRFERRTNINHLNNLFYGKEE